MLLACSRPHPGIDMSGVLQETYNYYYLPFCKAKPNEKEQHDWGGLGEVLQGNELIHSQLDIKFKGVPCSQCALLCMCHKHIMLAWLPAQASAGTPAAAVGTQPQLGAGGAGQLGS